jgi:uncharacterized protein YdeI (YjbR/CyaY-like superfamily)
MPPRPSPQELSLLELADRSAWEAWLEQNHESGEGVWLKFAKKGAPRATVTPAEAIEIALCFGWIDGQLGAVDEHFYRQRFTHRRPRSRWSRINRDRATELIAAGLMRPAGLEEVNRAHADGRWQAAYEPQSTITAPPDFQAALDANQPAAEFFATLTGSDRYAFLYRIGDVSRPQTRARRIAQYVDLLARRRTLH